MLTRVVRRTGVVTAVAATLLFAASGPASATFDQGFVTPDIDIEEDIPVVVSSMPAVATFDVSIADATESAEATVTPLPATCTVTVDNPFNGTRDRTTKKMSGTFAPTATTSCGSTAISLYTVVVERKTVNLTTTDVRTAPPDSCQVGTTPCAEATSTTTYNCSPCNPASWRARSTHRLTLPANRFFVDYPPSCSKLTPTIIECVLTTGKLTIK